MGGGGHWGKSGHSSLPVPKWKGRGAQTPDPMTDRPRRQPMTQFSHLIPTGLSSTPLEETAYRRGFDQGFYACADLLGIDPFKIQYTAYKTRLKAWRYGCFVAGEPPSPTAAERAEIRALLP
jgi:hypothetical protein